MLNALAKLWKLIVKALTMATDKGDKYVSSLKSPVDELNEKIEHIDKSRKKLIHAYYEIVRECNTHDKRIEEYESDCSKLETRIRGHMESGDESRAKNEARLLLQKETTLKRTKNRKLQLDDRRTQMERRIETLKTDIALLEDKVVDLRAVLAMRDDSKMSASGVGGEFDQSIADIMKDADKQIQDVEIQDESWKTVDETLNPVDDNDDTSDVDDILKRFRS